MSLAVVRRGMALGLSLVMLVAATALADDLKADADLLDGIQNSINLGDVAPGSTHGVDVGFALTCKSLSHLSAGATLAIEEDLRDIPTGASLALTPGQLVVPDAWPADNSPCSGSEGPGTVTPAHLDVTAPDTEGDGYAYSLFFHLSDDETTGNLIAFTVYLERRGRAAAPAGRHHRPQPPRRPRGHHRDHDRRRRDRPLDRPDGDR